MPDNARQSGSRLAAAKKTAAAKKSNETAVLFMTDLHFGKKTSTFGVKKLEKRLDTFAEKVCGIKSLIGNGYDFDRLVICLLGDVVDGTGIYPTQAHHQEDSSVIEQMHRFTDILWRTVGKISEPFPETHVECIPGNHGRVSKFADEADNWDLVAYQMLRQKAMAEPSKKVAVRYGGKEGLWIRKVGIRSHKYLLYHGQAVRSFSNIPWYGLFTRIGRWATTKKFGKFDAFACGHFHTNGYHPLNRIKIFMNGTAVTSDDWAIEQFGYESSNDWWLVGCSDNHVTTFQFPLTV